ALALLIGGFLLIRNASFVQQSPVLSRFASISLNDTKTQARAFIWPMAWQGFKNDPLLGSGQENFNYIFNANYNPAMYHHEQWFDRAHNVVLDWLTAGGLLGLLTYLSLFVATLWLVWKRPDISFIERALLSGLLAAYFFHNLFVFDNLISYILFGSVLAYVHFKSTKLERPWGGEGEEFDDSDMRTAGPLVLIVLCFCIYFLNWRGYQTNALLIDALRTLATTPVQADAALASFQRAVSYDTLGRAEVVERLIDASGAMNSSSVPLETRQKFFELTRSAVEKQTKRVPDDARYRVFAGSFYGMYGDYPKAEEEMLLAAHLSPNKQSILYQLGNLYVAEKAYDKAVAVYKQAYDAYPQNDDAARFYAMALTYAGKEAEAHTFLESRIGNESMTSDIFLQAYADTGNWTKVVSLLKTRIAANPSNMEDRKNLAAAYLQLGDKADAIATFREMITIDPSFKAQGEAYIQAIQQGK
ncbi:MAG TPA: O-antigen ligase family protein, partial [Candidatus Paceibacterota bacterium]